MIVESEISTVAVGRRLCRLRTEARLSNKEAGQLIHVCAATYAKIERGRRALKPREAVVFAVRYGVDVRWVTCGLSPKECEVIDVIRRPETVPTPKVSTPLAWPVRNVG